MNIVGRTISNAIAPLRSEAHVTDGARCYLVSTGRFRRFQLRSRVRLDIQDERKSPV